MPLQIIEGKIEQLEADAIVNIVDPTANNTGEDNPVFRAAGSALIEAYRQFGRVEIGTAVVTEGFNLPCKYVIHIPRPRAKGSLFGNDLLSSCYEASIEAAEANGCKSIAIPVISIDNRPASLQKAIKVAESSITRSLQNYEITVLLVVNSRENLAISKKTKDEFQQLFGCLLPEEEHPNAFLEESELSLESDVLLGGRAAQQIQAAEKASKQNAALSKTSEQVNEKARALDRLIRDRDESFQQMLMRKIAERGLTDAQCYKRANIDRKLFSKIRSDVNYKPSKPTAVAFAIALELSMNETEELLGKAGYALSKSHKFDIIIRYFIEHQIYSVIEINEVLFYYDQSLLGG